MTNKIRDALERKFDICIVGAGAIGLSIAAEFANSRHSVLLLESGSSEGDRDLMQVENSGDVSVGLEGSRAKGVGGSTQIWGGQALPLKPIDFCRREWISQTGWPIGEDSVKPYYDRVDDLFSVQGVDYKTNIWGPSWRNSHDVSRDFEKSALDLEFSKMSPRPNFDDSCGHKVRNAANIVLLTDWTVSELIESAKQNIILRVVVQRGKKKEVLEADRYILCGGGIENPRLLLNSRNKSETGIGNQYDQVGRCFQDHLGLYGARLIPKNFSKFTELFASRIHEGVKFVPKISLSDEQQREHQLLSITGNLESQTKPNDPINVMRKLYNLFRARKVTVKFARLFFSLFLHPIEVIKSIYNLIWLKRIFLPRGVEYYLVANIESEPNLESRIVLSDHRDRFGQQIADICWRLYDPSRLTANAYYTAMKKVLERSDIAEVIIKTEIGSSDSNWRQHCYSLYHHMGATRMSSSPQSGVVDQNCKVHEIQNLYVAGTSVFPAGGASNPTFTALALALRLADYLKSSN